MKNRREAERMNRLALQLFEALGRNVNCVPVRDWGDLRRTYPGEVLLPKRFPVECGTESGYTAHRRKGEEPCGRCKSAHVVAVRKSNEARQRRRIAAA